MGSIVRDVQIIGRDVYINVVESRFNDKVRLKSFVGTISYYPVSKISSIEYQF